MDCMADGYEVALVLMGKDPTDDNDFENSEEAVDKFLSEKYGIDSIDGFSALLWDLAKLADRAKSDLSDKVYSGFATMKDGHGFWLLKVEHK